MAADAGHAFLRLIPKEDGVAFSTPPNGWWRSSERAFGGQIIAHAMMAASQVSRFKRVHAVHVHFVAPSNMVRTHYRVRSLREGRTFELYAVSAVEDGSDTLIATAIVGFQAPTPSGSAWAGERLHAPVMPSVPPPSTCEPGAMKAWEEAKISGVDQVCWRIRRVDRLGQLCWVAWDAGAATSPTEHAAAIGFLSDLQFLWAAFWPHTATHEMQMITSLDHSIHFHEPVIAADGWHLFELWSDVAGADRALVHGRIWSTDGVLVASMVQEGVLRLRAKL